jgi:biotin carboxyl carrier protein
MAEDKNKVNYSTFELDGVEYKTILPERYKSRKKYVPVNPKLVKAFIPGTIIKIFTRKGRKVSEGDNLLILEAMKMQTYVQAPNDGKIKQINIKKGQMVSKGFVMIEMV